MHQQGEWCAWSTKWTYHANRSTASYVLIIEAWNLVLGNRSWWRQSPKAQVAKWTPSKQIWKKLETLDWLQRFVLFYASFNHSFHIPSSQNSKNSQRTLFKPKPLTIPFVFSQLTEIAKTAGNAVRLNIYDYKPFQWHQKLAILVTKQENLDHHETSGRVCCDHWRGQVHHSISWRCGFRVPIIFIHVVTA